MRFMIGLPCGQTFALRHHEHVVVLNNATLAVSFSLLRVETVQ